MAWEKVKLGDVAETNLGKMLDQHKNRGDFHPYLANVNVRWGSFDLENLPLMKFESDELDRFGLRYGDLIVCEGGEPGRCAIWKENLPGIKFQKALHRVRVKDCMDYRYVFYWFLYAGKRHALDQYFTGSTIKHMPADKLRQVVVDYPPLKIQKKIGEVLSAYDNLIENNQKQIKLLEEAAQRLYKEWFIDLRFPGHETTKIQNDLPEGWTEQTVLDFVFQEIGGGWGEDEVTQKSSLPAFVIRGADIDGINHGDFSNIPFRFHSESNLEQRTLQDGDIVFEVSGGSKTEGVAKTLLITDKLLEQYSSPVICASFCKKISPKEGLSQYFYDALRYMRMSGITSEYDKKSASSIVNYRWKDFLSQQHLVLPSENVLRMYDKIAKPIYKNIQTKSIEIEKLKQARDRLLPKLMSGEIEV